MKTWLLIGIFLMALRFALYIGVSFACPSLRPSPLAKAGAALVRSWQALGTAAIPVWIVMIAFGIIAWPLGLGDVLFFSHRWLKGNK